MRWTVSNRVSASFALIIGLVVISSTFTFWRFWQVIEAQRIIECRTTEVRSTYEILASVSQLNGVLRAYIIARLNNDPDESSRLHHLIDKLWSDVDKSSDTLQRLDPRYRSETAHALLSQLKKDVEEARRAQYDYLRMEESGDEGAHQASMSTNVNSTLWAEGVRTDAQQLVDAVTSLSNAESKRAASLSVLALTTALGVFFLVIGVGITTALLVRKRIASTIPQLVTHAQQIARGDIDVGELPVETDDEIGDLNRSYSAMIAYFREIAAISESFAAGDFSGDVKPRSERDVLGTAFQCVRDGLEILIHQGRHSATEIAASSAELVIASDRISQAGLASTNSVDEVSQAIHEMSAGLQKMVRTAQMQSGAINESSTSVQHLASSIQHVTENVSHLLSFCDHSRQVVSKGVRVMGDSEQGLNRIKESNEVADRNHKNLLVRTSSIANIADCIEELADQTNLLALNAAIEAARAGEHGVGFAVLADELSKLSTKSTEATNEISELVRAIHMESEKADKHRAASSQAVTDGLTLATELRDALNSIDKAVNDVYAHAQMIEHETHKQAAGSSQIASAAEQLDQFTLNLTRSIEKQSAASDIVVTATRNLHEMAKEVSDSSIELAATATQIANMSTRLLKSNERFKLSSKIADDTNMISIPAFVTRGKYGINTLSNFVDAD